VNLPAPVQLLLRGARLPLRRLVVAFPWKGSLFKLQRNSGRPSLSKQRTAARPAGLGSVTRVLHPECLSSHSVTKPLPVFLRAPAFAHLAKSCRLSDMTLQLRADENLAGLVNVYHANRLLKSALPGTGSSRGLGTCIFDLVSVGKPSFFSILVRIPFSPVRKSSSDRDGAQQNLHW